MAENRFTGYEKYEEDKPRYLRMVIWRIINATIFTIIGFRGRTHLLRAFGANISGSSYIYASVRIYAPWNLEMEDGCVLGPKVEVYNKAKVCIGRQAVISQKSFICTAGHDINSPRMALVAKPIMVGRYSWVAAQAIVLPGVMVGEGAVVAAGAVVAKSVEPWTVVGGNPAKMLKVREISR